MPQNRNNFIFILNNIKFQELLDLCLAASGRDPGVSASDLLKKVDVYYSKTTSGKFGNCRNCFRILPQGKTLFQRSTK